MICPVELANEMSAFWRGLEVELPAGGRHGSLPRVRHGAGHEDSRSDFASDGEEDHLDPGRDRQMRRWYERYREFGYDGLFDRRLRRPSPKRVPVETVERVLGLYRDRYFDLNVRHFCEKLRQEQDIHLSYTWAKLALQRAGLVKKGHRRGVHVAKRGLLAVAIRQLLQILLWNRRGREPQSLFLAVASC
jgi:hypothetical protein